MANYRDLPTKKLLEYEQYFVGQLGSFGNVQQSQIWEQQCLSQIELLRSEIARRSLAEESKRQHQEVYGIGRKTLFWATVGGVTGIALVLIEIWPLIHHTFFSKAQSSSAPQATPAMPRQSQSPTIVSPEPEAGSSSATP